MPTAQDFLNLRNSFEVQISKADIEHMPAWETHKRPVILVSDDNIEHAVSELKQYKVLGFDTESRPTFKRGGQDHPIALIQLASQDKCWLFQINKISNLDSLAHILQSGEIRKVGLGLSSDRRRFKNDFSVQIHNLIDLDVVFKSLGRKNQMGAKQMVAQLFGKKLKKSKKQSLSNWAADHLNPAQISYASDDAFCVVDAWYDMQRKLLAYQAFVPNKIRVLFKK
ncbi:3'-5' exonuclease [Pelagibaculum spongiae]|uniref:3'-5' exonuclease n=1 Tax=Pelagibaculum spongiae TaxID=2080658 RepID=A0A2V1GZN8_9GAMM|nr:3'-5' exonuclease [Pelagibaculum spongiae]PVZ72196.1 hypothetical protein DC094_04050 [Pelagibaculum spongiae]